MIKKALFSTFFTLAVVLVAFGADIDGRWAGKIMDQYDIAYEFKSDGEKLTGTTIGPDGNTLAISDGTIKGEDIAFSMDVMGTKTPVTGKLKGDVLTLSFNAMGNPISFDLKKQAKP